MNQATRILLGIPLGFYRVWVLMTLWGWFLVPLGLPAIGMAWAWGIGTVYSCISGTRFVSKEEVEFNKTGMNLLLSLVHSSFTLAFGYAAWRLMR